MGKPNYTRCEKEMMGKVIIKNVWKLLQKSTEISSVKLTEKPIKNLKNVYLLLLFFIRKSMILIFQLFNASSVINFVC